MRGRLASSISCDENVSLRLKMKFYKVVVIPFMLQGSESVVNKELTCSKDKSRENENAETDE